MPDFKCILDIHPNPCVIHIDFVPKYANNAFAVFSGMSTVEEVLKLDTIRILFEESHWPEAQRRYNQAIETGLSTLPEVINHTDLNGNAIIAEITDKVIDWYGEKAMCTFISVVTDQVRRERTLRDMANRDALTNLYNRRFLVEQFENRNLISSRSQYLAMVDIDHFKQVNDTWGHPVGDLVLRRLACLIEAFAEPDECVSRLGGEEFGLLILANSQKEASRRFDCLRSTIERFVVRIRHTNRQLLAIKCTVSIGATVLVASDNFVSASLRADEALYKAKNAGRNQVASYNPVARTLIIAGE